MFLSNTAFLNGLSYREQNFWLKGGLRSALINNSGSELQIQKSDFKCKRKICPKCGFLNGFLRPYAIAENRFSKAKSIPAFLVKHDFWSGSNEKQEAIKGFEM